jgi:DNA-binding CsgD family transcriptional regulator
MLPDDPVARHLLERTRRPEGSITAAVVGIAGSGKSELLDLLEVEARSAGHRVLRAQGRRSEQGLAFGALEGPLEADACAELADLGNGGEQSARVRARSLLLDRFAEQPSILLVDDAQWLDAASLTTLLAVTERADTRPVRIVCAHRPANGRSDLATLDEALVRRGSRVVMQPFDEATTAIVVTELLGQPASAALVDVIQTLTEGVPLYVNRLTRGWMSSGAIAAGDLRGRPPLPPTVVETVRTRIEQLSPAARLVVRALSFGSSLDDALLAAITGVDPGVLAESVEELRAAGLLTPTLADVLPVVAQAVEHMSPLTERRTFHARLAGALAERGGPIAPAAEHLRAAGVRGSQAAEAYVAAGNELLRESPELARQWYDLAVQAGAERVALAARRAEAAFLVGDPGDALALADAVVGDTKAPDRNRGLVVAAAALAVRGHWTRSAATFERVGELARGRLAVVARLQAVPGHLATGDVERARRVVTEAEKLLDRPAPLHAESALLTAEGLLASLGGDPEGALRSLVEAAELLEAGRHLVVLPDTPHALCAVVAFQSNEIATAERVLTRAIELGVGGPAAQPRHRLLLGWAGLRTGRWAAAQAALDTFVDGDHSGRDALLAAGLELGIARRAGDVERLMRAWPVAGELLVRHPVDLWTLDAVCEIVVAGYRLGHRATVEPAETTAAMLIERLGGPPSWHLGVLWQRLQAGVSVDDVGVVVEVAALIAALPPTPRRLVPLRASAGVWASVLTGRVDPDEVQRVAQALQSVGLPWEAARLTGTAAIRSGDEAVTRLLLGQARDLRATVPSGEVGEVPSAAALSDREMEVASRIVAGLTYKEIGAQLFISPKTVEHHVAKIRQKVGATTRAELLAALKEFGAE